MSRTDSEVVKWRLPSEVVDRLREHVDGVRYKSVAHLAACIMLDWLEDEEDDELEEEDDELDDEPEASIADDDDEADDDEADDDDDAAAAMAEHAEEVAELAEVTEDLSEDANA
jgi:Arc/MetJ-type ribon-helix-helix transcriptional regulator